MRSHRYLINVPLHWEDRMISIRQLMIDDHNHCDDLFIEAENLVAEKKWSEASTSLKHFIAATLEHFGQEENILFHEYDKHFD